MKKKLNLIIFVLISMFAFNMSAKAAYSCKADGNECDIKISAAEGSLKNCSVVSGNFSARFDSSTKTCYVKSNVISQSGFLGTIKLEKAPGAYGVGGTYETNVQFTSAGGTGESNVTEIVANGTFQPDGSWTNVSSYVTGAITSCTIKSGAAKLDTSNHGCKVSSSQSGDVVLKVVHTSVGAVWTTYVTFNYGTAAGGGTGIDNGGEKKESDDSSLENISDALQICDANESPKTVAAFRLVGIFITIIKIIAPIIIIVMGMFDMSKAVLEGKDDSIKKQAISLLRRAIACVLIFFVPTIMRNLFHFIDGWDKVESEYSTCIDCILGDSSCPEVGFGAGDFDNSDLGGSSNSNDSSNYSGGSTTHTSSSGNTHGGSSGSFGGGSSTHTSSSGNTHSDSSGSFGGDSSTNTSSSGNTHGGSGGSFGGGSSTNTSSSGQTSGGSSGKIDNDLHGHF